MKLGFSIVDQLIMVILLDLVVWWRWQRTQRTNWRAVTGGMCSSRRNPIYSCRSCCPRTATHVTSSVGCPTVWPNFWIRLVRTGLCRLTLHGSGSWTVYMSNVDDEVSSHQILFLNTGLFYESVCFLRYVTYFGECWWDAVNFLSTTGIFPLAPPRQSQYQFSQ